MAIRKMPIRTGLGINWGGVVLPGGGAPAPAPLPPNRTIAPGAIRRPIDRPPIHRIFPPITVTPGAPVAAPPVAEGPSIPLNAPAPPTIGLGQGISLVNDPGYVAATNASAAAGNHTGQANAAVLTLAQRVRVQASYVARFVSQAAANDILSGAHLAS